jgi:hypothetical protein
VLKGLSFDVLYDIFPFVTAADLVRNVAPCCRVLYCLLQKDFFWRTQWSNYAHAYVNELAVFSGVSIEFRRGSSPKRVDAYTFPSQSRGDHGGITLPANLFAGVAGESFRRTLYFFQSRPYAVLSEKCFRQRIFTDDGEEDPLVAAAAADRSAVEFETNWTTCLREAFAVAAYPIDSEEHRAAIAGGRQAAFGYGVLHPTHYALEGFAQVPEGMEPVVTWRGSSVAPRFGLEDLLVYNFMLTHLRLSDVHEHFWPQEYKMAVCCTIASPFGGAVETRFFISALQGSFPRFYVKHVFAECTLPESTIGCRFLEDSYAHTLFVGGYGRVEVDIAPTVNAGNLLRLREALHLPQAFPMELLWNVAMVATGGVANLRSHAPSFLLFYRATLLDACLRSLRT